MPGEQLRVPDMQNEGPHLVDANIYEAEVGLLDEVQPLVEIVNEDYEYIPLGRLSDLGVEAKGSIGEKVEPLNDIDATVIESAIAPLSRVVCCIDGRARYIAEKIDSGKKRSFKLHGKASGSPMKFAGGAAGVAYSGYLAGLIDGVDAENYAKRTMSESNKKVLRPMKLKASVHSDEHANGDNCGCGACDKEKVTNQDIREEADAYRGLYDALATQSPSVFPPSEDADRSSVVYHSKLAIDNDFIPSGKEITRVYKPSREKAEEHDEALDHDESRVVMQGGHDERAIVINLDPDETVDKHKLPFQLFWVDLGPFSREVIRAFREAEGIHSRRNANRLIYSGTIFQLATAKQLAHKDMPVYIRRRKKVNQSHLENSGQAV